MSKKKEVNSKDWNLGVFANGHFDAWDYDLVVGAFTLAEADVVRGALLAYSRSNKAAGPMANEIADVIIRLTNRNRFVGAMERDRK